MGFRNIGLILFVLLAAALASADWYGSSTARGITGFAVAADEDTASCPVITCVNDQILYDTGTKDSIGCTIYKCVPVGIVTETVKCVFNQTDSIAHTGVQAGDEIPQSRYTCYASSAYGEFSCSGAESCSVEVKAPKGTELTWKSSCGGYAFTKMDGENEYAYFRCGTEPPQDYVKEQVKCVFNGSEKYQECYGRNEKGESFSCGGDGACVADVRGADGSQMTWKSTCGGYAYTKLDGKEEKAEFYCRKDDAKLEEQVNCVFSSSDSEQKCSASNKNGTHFACSGVGGCALRVSGIKGEHLVWNSSCRGYAYTTIDGGNEYAKFNCSETERAVVAEKVRCIFKTKSGESLKEHKCYANLNSYEAATQSTTPAGIVEGTATPISGRVTSVDIGSGPTEARKIGASSSGGGDTSDSGSVTSTIAWENTASCKGVENCIADVKGFKGTKVVWKSDCGGYAYTLMDGDNENAVFYCADEQEPPTTELVSESVKCIFSNNGSGGEMQKCYTVNYEDFPTASCSGTESCVIEVRGRKGKEIGWKSSCGGYATTVLDGDNEYANFECTPSAHGQVFTLNIAKGWNLVSVPSSSHDTKSDTCDAAELTYYWYNKESEKYEKVSSPQGGKAYWANNTGGACNATYVIKEAVALSELSELGKGWNFTAIVPEMIGDSIESLGDCDVKVAYSYNAQARKWILETGRRITEADLGKGIAINSNNACSLAASIGPPPLPSESVSGGSGSGSTTVVRTIID